MDIIQQHNVIAWLCRSLSRYHNCYECGTKLYCKSVQHDDTGQILITVMCVLVQHPHLEHHPSIADGTADPPVDSSASKPPPPPKQSVYETVPLNGVLWRHSLAKSERAGNVSIALTVILKWPKSMRPRLCHWRRDIQPEQYLQVNSTLTWIYFENFFVTFELSVNCI